MVQPITTPDQDYVELSFGPQWIYISCVRAFIAGFFAIGVKDKIMAEKISMAITELLENSVKYSSKGGAYVRAEISENQDRVMVNVRNHATPEQIDILKQELAEVNQGTPEQAYLRKLEEAVRRTDGKSRIGLARIRYEAGAALALEYNDEVVDVSATIDLTPLSPES